jgi:GntR family transcriptional regulator
LNDISCGIIKSGDAIPTESELMRNYHASRTTVRRAISSLVNEGRIIRKPGKGSFVKEISAKTHVRLTGSYSDILGVAKRTVSKVLRFEYVNPPADTMKELRVKQSEYVLRIDRVRFTKGIPFLYSINYVPEDVGRSFSIKDLEELTMTELLTNKGHQVLSKYIQDFSATMANGYIADILKLPSGYPLLEIKRIAISKEERPVNLLFGYFRSDIYVFTAVFSI